MSTVYDTDLAAWAEAQAALLKTRRIDGLDLDHLIDELESLRRQDTHRLWEHLCELLVWFLAWNYASEQRLPHAWWYVRTVDERVTIEVILGSSLSLQTALVEDLPECYAHGREVASEETGLPLEIFPETCP